MKKLKVLLLGLLIAAAVIALAGCKRKVPEEVQEPAEDIPAVTESTEKEEKPEESLKEIDENILMPEVQIF